jgi:hypothetical protein
MLSLCQSIAGLQKTLVPGGMPAVDGKCILFCLSPRRRVPFGGVAARRRVAGHGKPNDNAKL